VGIQLIKLQELKTKLEKEGLFAESRKRGIPKYPKTIGIIAGNDSAAYKDIVTNIQRRYPITELIFFPSLVQGKQAPDDIIRALDKAYQTPLDVLIIGRGGGSEEDLSAFNDERVVRKIAQSPCPTIGAIGHEINTTLADLVCDKRASTPTGAAELATRDKADIMYEIHMLNNRLIDAIDSKMALAKQHFLRLSDKPYFSNPRVIYEKQLTNIALLKEQLKSAMIARVNDQKDILTSLKEQMLDPTPRVQQYRMLAIGHLDTMSRLLNTRHETLVSSLQATRKQLESLSPYQVLERGYSILTNEEGNIITNSNDVNIGEVVTTTLKHGKISSVVKERK
jgi:exodeoxyribonuclease VII large subunit